jgi:hypothetical protein
MAEVAAAAVINDATYVPLKAPVEISTMLKCWITSAARGIQITKAEQCGTMCWPKHVTTSDLIGHGSIQGYQTSEMSDKSGANSSQTDHVATLNVYIVIIAQRC